MVKHLLLISACIVITAFSMKAQITITTTDAPSVGLTKSYANDTLQSYVNGILPGNSGANQTWNFSTLVSAFTDTMAFVAPNTTPYSTQFPASNLAAKTRMNGQTAYYYLKKDADGVYALGLVGNVSTQLNVILTVPIVPQFSMLRTPSNYNDTYTENYSTRVKAAASPIPLVDSIKNNSWTNLTSLIDGWGSITTTSGTCDVLRQKVTEITMDTTWVHSSFTGWTQFSTSKDTTITYRWWGKNIGVQVMEMERDAHTTAKTKNVKWVLGPLTSVESLAVNSDISLFPNPASDNIYINNLNASESYVIKVYDLLGKELKNVSVKNSTQAFLPVNELNNGFYFFSVFRTGKKVATQKIFINR
ncbi:MAG: T9SS type A sorting domain-containing protein [Bacteroidia bacterium]|nr:T9SS type A sorting domain-containing protein [Bacteroidia bacterium]